MSGPNVGYASLQIIPSAKGFAANLSRETEGPLASSGRKAGKKAGAGYVGGFSPSLKSLAKGIGAVYAGSQAVGFLKGAVSEASDLNEAGTKLQAVFGKATGQVLDFSKAGAKGLGQSNLAVQNAAALFGVYGRAAGLAGKANADFSTKLVTLSTDLASFYNTDPAEAAAALASGLRGETEPLRAYGVLLDATTVKAEALRMGLISSTKDALTPQAKVLATQALIMKQTAIAQGDFARTSGGLANQQRILSAQTADLKGKIGKALLPAAVAATKGLNGLFSMSGTVGKGFTALKDLFIGGDFTGAFADVFGVEEDSPIVEKLFRVRSAVKGFADAAIPALKGFAAQAREALVETVIPAFRRFLAVAGPALVKVGALVAQVAATAAPVLRRLGEVVLTQIVPAFLKLWTFVASRVYPVVAQLADIVRENLLPVLAQIATFIVAELVPRLVEIASAVAKNLRPAFDALAETFRAQILPALKLIVAKFAEWWPTIKRVLSVVVTVVGWLLKLAAAILGRVLPVLIRLAGFLIGTVVRVLVTVITWVVKLVGAALSVGRAFGTAGAAVGHAVGWMAGKFSDLVGFVTKLPGKIASAAKGMWDGLKDAFRSAVNFIIDKWNGLEFRIPGFDPPGPGPKFGGFTLGMPNIPRLADGGILRARPGGHLVNVAEGGEDEAVIPLSKLATVLRTASRDAGHGTSSASATPVVVPLYLDGHVLAEAVFEIGGRDYAAGRKEF